LETSRAYGLHIATGPAVLGLMWLHSTHFGYALSLAVNLSFIASLTTGAILGAYPRSPQWETARRMLLAGHIVMSCAGSAFALVPGFTAPWYCNAATRRQGAGRAPDQDRSLPHRGRRRSNGPRGGADATSGALACQRARQHRPYGAHLHRLPPGGAGDHAPAGAGQGPILAWTA